MQAKNQTLIEPNNRHLPLIILDLLFDFIGFGFLTFPILVTGAILMFDYLIIFGPKLPFLEYLSFLPERSSNSPIRLDGDDVTRVYSLLTMVFWGLSRLARELLSMVRRLAGYEPSPDTAQSQTLSARHLLIGFARYIPRRLFLAVLPTTIVFAIAFVAMPLTGQIIYDDLIKFNLMFIVFYVIAVVAIGSHVIFGGFSKLILTLAQRYFATGLLGRGDGQNSLVA